MRNDGFVWHNRFGRRLDGLVCDDILRHDGFDSVEKIGRFERFDEHAHGAMGASFIGIEFGIRTAQGDDARRRAKRCHQFVAIGIGQSIVDDDDIGRFRRDDSSRRRSRIGG